MWVDILAIYYIVSTIGAWYFVCTFGYKHKQKASVYIGSMIHSPITEPMLIPIILAFGTIYLPFMLVAVISCAIDDHLRDRADAREHARALAHAEHTRLEITSQFINDHKRKAGINEK